MRWNLVLDHGQRVADLFLSSYRSIATTAVEDDQPYWDLVSLFDLLLKGVGPGHVGSEDLARLERYAYAVLDAYP